MKRYSKNFKETALQKAFSSEKKSIRAIALEMGVNPVSLYRWVKDKKDSMPKKNNSSKELSSRQKFQLVLQANQLQDEELGKFLRENGLYAHQIEAWKNDMLGGLQTPNTPGLKKEHQKSKSQVKELQKELRKKDKALAEASALLVLKKKAELIWGVEEEEEQS